MSRWVDAIRRRPFLYRVARRLARTPPAQAARARLVRPQISVIVPFYNVEEYLAECLDSLEAQTFRDFEVLLVDDGSPDGSRAIAETYAGRDPASASSPGRTAGWARPATPGSAPPAASS